MTGPRVGAKNRVGLLRGPLCLLAVAAALTPDPALAHGELMRSEPASGEVLSTAPTQVTLWFSQELTSGGQLRVFDGGAQRMDDGNTRVSVTEPKSMTVDLRPLSPGSYQVEWEAISLEDGDKSGGSFAFSVGEPGTTSGGAGTSRSGRGSTLLAGALAIAILALAVALVALVRRRPAA